MDSQKYTLPDYMRMLRSATGMEQADLARELGISRSYVAAIEAGWRMPSWSVLYKLRKNFQFSLDAMVDAVIDTEVPE